MPSPPAGSSPDHHPQLERGLGVPCAEAQADGVPCDETKTDCTDCERAQRAVSDQGTEAK